jgi:hypothetical protein
MDSPSLPLPAGLTRTEEPEAGRLFWQVIDELGLAPTLPTLPNDPTARRWAQLIVDGDLDPGFGGTLIWQEGWSELGYPDVLQLMVEATCLCQDHVSSSTTSAHPRSGIPTCR